jgi:hypothetical protein
MYIYVDMRYAHMAPIVADLLDCGLTTSSKTTQLLMQATCANPACFMGSDCSCTQYAVICRATCICRFKPTHTLTPCLLHRREQGLRNLVCSSPSPNPPPPFPCCILENLKHCGSRTPSTTYWAATAAPASESNKSLICSAQACSPRVTKRRSKAQEH